MRGAVVAVRIEIIFYRDIEPRGKRGNHDDEKKRPKPSFVLKEEFHCYYSN